MICPRENSLYDLIGRYVHGDISPSQGELLLRYLDKDPGAMKILQRNLLIDLYLDQIYTVRQKDMISSIRENHLFHLRDFIILPLTRQESFPTFWKSKEQATRRARHWLTQESMKFHYSLLVLRRNIWTKSNLILN